MCIRLVDLLILQVIDLVEDEHFFLVTMFMKTTLKNILTLHLKLVIDMVKHKIFTL
jgi:hypothetical protein